MGRARRPVRSVQSTRKRVPEATFNRSPSKTERRDQTQKFSPPNSTRRAAILSLRISTTTSRLLGSTRRGSSPSPTDTTGRNCKHKKSAARCYYYYYLLCYEDRI